MNESHALVIHTPEGSAYLLESRACSIGRDQKNAIVIDTPSVSRQHALLLRVPRGSKNIYRLIDGNAQGIPSRNGTLVNGERCSSRELTHGDLISFGTEIRATYMVIPSVQANMKRYLEAKQIHRINDAPTDAKSTVVAN